MTTVNTIPVDCPECKKRFKTTVVFSYGYANQTTDLRPIYWGFNPVPLWVARCPFCSFADHVQEFKQVAFPEGEKLEDYWDAYEKRKEELKGLEKSKVTNGASERFEIVKRYEKQGEDPVKIARVFKDAVDAIRMNATSPSPFTSPPDMNNPTKEMDAECARRCARAFETSSDPDNIVYAYMAAEHYRLAAQFDLAKKWYEEYREAVKHMDDPPVSLEVVKRVENEALKGNSAEMYIENTKPGIFVRG